MKRFMVASCLAFWALCPMLHAQPLTPVPLTPAPVPEQKSIPPLVPPSGDIKWGEKRPLQDPTDPRLDPRLNELLNPTRVVAMKQVPIAIRGRVVTPTGASVLLEFGGKMVMLRKGTNVSVSTVDGTVTFRIVDITENEVLLETPSKEILSIR